MRLKRRCSRNDEVANSHRELDFGFFEPNVLANFGVVFLHSQLVRRGALILRSGVKIASSFFRNEANENAITFCRHGELLGLAHGTISLADRKGHLPQSLQIIN